MHPAHVPFEAEAQPAQVGRPRDPGEGGRLLGDGDGAGKEPVGALVHLSQEGDSLHVLVPAELVRRPLALLAGIVEIQHRGDGVDPQPVDVVAVEPEQGIGHQEVAHLGPAVVEDQGPPVGVPSTLRIGVLIEGGPVEATQREIVCREMRGDPVEDYPDPRPVQQVDHRREVGRRPESRGRGVIAGHLIAPGAVERMLGQRQELDVGESKAPAVRNQQLPGLSVAEPGAVRIPAPRSQVHLVDGHRGRVRVVARAFGHPGVVAPREVARLPYARRGLRAHLHGKRQGIRLQTQRTVTAQHLELVELALRHAGHEQLPDA